MAGRARAELAAKNNPQLADRSWLVWKHCGYCDRSICVNNYDDRKARTPKFMGFIICPVCDPRHIDDRWQWRDGVAGAKPRITNPVLYRTIISVYIVKLLAGARPDRYDKIVEKARQFFAEDGMVKPLPEPNRDRIDREIYG